jgi:hypothetical protein
VEKKRVAPVRASTIVRQVVGQHLPVGQRSQGAAAFDVFDAFRKIGPPVTRYAEPFNYRRGTLSVRVYGSAWLTELGFLEEEILGKINQHLRDRKVQVKNLRLYLGSGQPKPEARAQPWPILPPDLEQRIEAWSEVISDPDIRAAWLSAAKRDLAKSK